MERWLVVKFAIFVVVFVGRFDDAFPRPDDDDDVIAAGVTTLRFVTLLLVFVPVSRTLEWTLVGRNADDRMMLLPVCGLWQLLCIDSSACITS